jgi:hypothetical protein
MEGYSSLIKHDGSQPVRDTLRSDCIGESAGALAFAHLLGRDHVGQRIAANLVEFNFSRSLQHPPQADPNSPTYGLLSWTSSPGVYYGDDNATAMLGMTAAISLLEDYRWNELLLRCMLGIYAPHYEAYLWACVLWAFRQTGYEPFRSKPKTAIRMTMEAYPDDWRWTNGIAQERARMLLPLAWLVRTEDTTRHRRWLRKMGREVLNNQVPCGALMEELGGPGMGSYGPPKTNEDYGDHEATLLQANGDPISDLLYTTNFAFLGLHEAAAATGEALFVRGENDLAQFLCRIHGAGRSLVQGVRPSPLGLLGEQRRCGLGSLVHRDRVDPSMGRLSSGNEADEDLPLGTDRGNTDQETPGQAPGDHALVRGLAQDQLRPYLPYFLAAWSIAM